MVSLETRAVVADVGPFIKIEFRDLDFAEHPIAKQSSGGTPYLKWVPYGMPRLPEKIILNAAYLFRSKEDADAGKKPGGTAFFVVVKSRHENMGYFYAVTNWHVACDDGASVLRVNRHDGGCDIFEFGPEDWTFDPRFDIAIIPVALDASVHRFSTIPTAAFATHETIAREKLGPGEDVFMVGRFVDHDGGMTNRPAVRFGNISVMPTPIKQPNGRMADTYCIDLHSRGGYSGSPVWAYRTPGFDLEEQRSTDIADAKILLSGNNLLVLLGIHMSQFPEEWEIKIGKQKPKKESSKVPLIRDGAYIEGLSGMTCVLPAWNIQEVLDLPKLKDMRDRSDDAQEERHRASGSPPKAE